MPGLNQIVSSRKWDARVQQGTLGQENRSLVDYPRLPTLIAPIDYALAGGMPCNVVSQVYGPYQGGKTTYAYLVAKALPRVCMRCLRPLALCKCKPFKALILCPKCRKPFGTCKCDLSNFPYTIEVCADCGKNRIDCDCKSQLRQKTFLAQCEGVPPDQLYFDVLGYDAHPNMVIALPEYGEQACAMVEAAVQSDDIGLVIVDSVAGIVPKAELDAQYEDSLVANQSRLMARLFRRISNRLVEEYRRGHLVAVLFINQMRSIIGASNHGPTETTPGGWASKHGYRLSARLAQLAPDKDNEFDKTTNQRLVNRFSASLLGPQSKSQMLTLAGKAEFKVVMDETCGVPQGTVLDSKFSVSLARTLGIFEKVGSGGYRLEGTDLEFRTLSEAEDMFNNYGVYNGVPGMDDVFRFKAVQAAKERAIVRIQQQMQRRIQTIRNPGGGACASATSAGTDSKSREGGKSSSD